MTKMKVKMRILTPSAAEIVGVVVVIVSCLIGSSNSTPDRERNRNPISSSNFDLIEHRFHHDIHSDDHFSDLGHSGSSLHHDSDSHLHPHGVCEPIKVGICVGIGYNQTTMPNALGHDSQADAEALLQTFTPLIQYGCHSNLKLFLCSAHVPMCTDKIPQPIGPCRSLCESVKLHCEPVLKEFRFSWPESLECSKFHPDNDHENLCNPGPSPSHYRGPSGSSSSSSVTPKRNGDPSDYHPSGNPKFPPHQPTYGGGGDSHFNPKKESPPGSGVLRVPSNSGNTHYPSSGGERNPFKPPYYGGNSNNPNIIGDGESECVGSRKVWIKGACYLRCSAASLDSVDNNGNGNSRPVVGGISLFHPSEKAFARNYALLWAILSLSAAVIALTLSLCSPRFSVAERPILYLALCQVLYSIGVIIGSTSSVSCVVDKVTETNVLAKGGMIPSSCAFVFLLTYFFGTATTMWWVVLSLSWLLSLNRNVASSLLQKESSLFHLFSWGISSILTSTALVHKKVDADELTGICGVGFQDMEALSLYNLIPLVISLVMGLIFLTFGLVVRIFFPAWNLPVCKLDCLKGRSNPTSGQNRAGCELSNNSAATTTASHQTGQTQTHLQNSFRAHHGYSPVLIAPPPGQCQSQMSHPHHHQNGYHHHHDNGYSRCQPYHHGVYPPPPTTASNNCMCSPSGHCGGSGGSGGGLGVGVISGSNNNNNGLLYSTGNSPASVVGIGGFQRLRALENTKAIWMRIGIFALVHSLPIACQVGTMAYELSGRDDWEKGIEHPNLQIFLLKMNMNVMFGISTGLFVLSTYSWSLLTFTRKLCNCLQFPARSKTKAKKSHHLHTSSSHSEQKLPPPSSVVAPLLSSANVNSTNGNVNGCSLPPIPVPSGSSSSSNNNHNSTMPILGSNNTFTTRGALAPHNIPSANGGNNFPRNHFNYPLPPIPPRNPDTISYQQQQHAQQRTDAWRRGETIV